MKRQMIKKLKGRGGESFIEVLAAIIVSALALTMLATMIVQGTKLTERSREVMEEHYDVMSDVADPENADTKSGTLAVSSGGSDYYLTDDGETITIRYASFTTADGSKIAGYAKAG